MLVKDLIKITSSRSVESQIELFCWTKSRAAVRCLADNLSKIDAREADKAFQIYQYRFF